MDKKTNTQSQRMGKEDISLKIIRKKTTTISWSTDLEHLALIKRRKQDKWKRLLPS